MATFVSLAFPPLFSLCFKITYTSSEGQPSSMDGDEFCVVMQAVGKQVFPAAMRVGETRTVKHHLTESFSSVLWSISCAHEKTYVEWHGGLSYFDHRILLHCATWLLRLPHCASHTPQKHEATPHDHTARLLPSCCIHPVAYNLSDFQNYPG